MVKRIVYATPKGISFEKKHWKGIKWVVQKLQSKARSWDVGYDIIRKMEIRRSKR